MQANKFNPLNSVMATSPIQTHPSIQNIKLHNVQIKAIFQNNNNSNKIVETHNKFLIIGTNAVR